MTKPPIFILGVPRSGTTLLRTILDSHSKIACGPETPWLGGHQPRSVMELWRALREEPWGYCTSYGMKPGVVDQAARGFVSKLMEEYAKSKGKSRWAEKTPDNSLYVDFLLTLFPEARCIHLVRDGLDVAVSTSVVEKHREGISGFLEKYLGLGPGVPPVDNNPFNAILKWNHWDGLIARSLKGRPHLKVRYEELVVEPETTVRQVMQFIGEDFEAGMLDYAKFRHEYPSWEWGSADVQARGRVTRDRIGRGLRELSPAQREILEPLARANEPGQIAPQKGEFSESAAATETFKRMTAYLNGLSRPLGLGVIEGPAAWEASWLWLNGLGRVAWRGKRVAHTGGAPALAWITAMLGAEVVFVDEQQGDHGALVKLARDLRVRVGWCARERDVGIADVVIAITPEGDADGAEEAVQHVRPGGLLAAAYGPSSQRRTMVRVVQPSNAT